MNRAARGERAARTNKYGYRSLQRKSRSRHQPRTDLAALKSCIVLRALIYSEHAASPSGKVPCFHPTHEDRTPSLQPYDDHYYCFGCGAHGDIIDYLMATRGSSFVEALKEAERLAGTTPPPAQPRQPRKRHRIGLACVAPDLPPDVVEAHYALAANLHHVPHPLQGRGLTLEVCRRLGVAEARGNARFPVRGPDGGVRAIKERLAQPRKGMKYRFVEGGSGLPAACSTNITDAAEILIIEGELNGFVAHLARPELGVMGIAGTNGSLWLGPLRGRRVFVYADAGVEGQVARDVWAEAADQAGAHVHLLDPWPEGDACVVAGTLGLKTLRERLS